MKTNSRPVVIAAGGTGGHVFPALAVADVLRERGVPVVWVGTRKGLEARVIPEAGYPIEWIWVSGLRGKGLTGRILGPCRLIGSVFQSIWLMAKLKPRAVLGMGGFVTGPVGVAAKIASRPLVLHEQNAVAGFTNRQLARFAKTVFTAMPNAFDDAINAITVGNPLRKEIELCADEKITLNGVSTTSNSNIKTHNDDRVLNVLVVGGSQGAQVLNNVIPDVVKQLDFSVKVVHQSGFSMYETVKDRYDSHSKKANQIVVKKFIKNMMEAYLSSDLVVCRSGAMTVSEIAAMSLPSVLVPFPYAVDDHQTRNAKYLEQAGAAVMIPQGAFTADKVCEVITSLHENRNRLKQMGLAARQCHLPMAAQTVANALLDIQDKVISQNHEVNA